VIEIVAALATVASLVVSITVLFRSHVAESYPVAFILTVILLITVVGVSSELLHWLNGYSIQNIRLFWIIVTVSSLAVMIIEKARIVPPVMTLTVHERATYGLLGSIFALTLLTPFAIAPNNWDSLTYHLSRAAHWLQNENLDFFPTANARQNVINPLPNLAQSHLLAADPSAHLVGLSQWLSGVAFCCAVGVLARLVWQQDRAFKMTQSPEPFIAASVVLAGTVPMLLSQMSTTQVDLVAGVPLAGSVVCLFWIKRARWGPAALLMGLCLGLAFAIKATALAVLIPTTLLFIWALVKQKKIRELFLVGASFILVFAILSLRHLWVSRTSGEYSEAVARYVFNETVDPESIVVNLVRNAASAMQTSSSAWNALLTDLSETIANLSGLNINPEESTIPGLRFHLSQGLSEDYVGAPLHIGLLLAAILTYLVLKQWKQNSKIGLLAVLFVLQFIFIAILFRWQPWINRFTFLPIAFASPVSAWLLLRLNQRPQYFVTYSLLVMAMIWVLVQPMRGLLGTSWLPEPITRLNSVPTHESPLRLTRYEQLFASGSSDTYENALKYVRSLDVTDLVLVGEEDSWEYPIWYFSAVNDVRWVIRHHPESSPQIPSQAKLDQGNSGKEFALLCINSCSRHDRGGVGWLDSSTVRVFGQGPTLIVGRVTPP